MTLNYDALTALTRDKFMPILIDNIFNSNVLCHRLLKNAEKLSGGVKIVTPVEYAKNSAEGFYNGYDVLNTTPSDPFTGAEWNWKQAYASITLSGAEEMKNAGDSQILGLLKAKMKNAEKSLKDMFGDKMFVDTPASANDITSLGQGSTSANGITNTGRTLGGIDSSTYSWWDSGIVKDGTGATALSDYTTVGNTYYLPQLMANVMSACSIDNDRPSIIIGGPAEYDLYESVLSDSKRYINNQSLADAGFLNLAFRNTPFVVDSHAPHGFIYFLNEEYLDFKVHSKRNFAFDGFKKPTNQDAMVAQIYWMGELTCTNPRMQGILKLDGTLY